MATVYPSMVTTATAPSDHYSCFMAAVLKILGVDGPFAADVPASVTRVLVAVTPALRSEVLFADRGIDECRLSADMLPRLLIAVWVIAGLAHHAGMQELTYQSMLRIVRNNSSLLEFLMYADSPVVWRRSAVVPIPPTHDQRLQQCYFALVRALLSNGRSGDARSLADVVSDVPLGEGLARVTMLRRLAERTQGRLGTVWNPPREGRQATLRPRLQHWLLRRIPEGGWALLSERPWR